MYHLQYMYTGILHHNMHTLGGTKMVAAAGCAKYISVHILPAF